MITSIQTVRQVQLRKKRSLEREFSWIKREFKDFHTLNDLDLYNVDRYIRLYAQPRYI